MAHPPASRWEEECGRIERAAREAAAGAQTLDALEAARVTLLGRKGSLTALLKSLKDMPLEDRRPLGELANALKARVEAVLSERRAALEEAETRARLGALRLDLTLPAKPYPQGLPHPLTRTLSEMGRALESLGFSRAEGPHIESEHYNFEALNIPAEHPARDMHDTFYLAGAAGLLRTHTSPVQIRHLESHAPPVRIYAPGRVFRRDAPDASHSCVFHQVEGLYVDEGVTLADLKGTLQSFLAMLLGPGTRTRFRPSFFPFTEPSTEVDVRCVFCSEGCPVCKQSGWLEMLGAGLVHPNVLAGVGLDPERHSGFAFGIGVERLAMLRLGVPDIRLFYENDLRFLEQFR